MGTWGTSDAPGATCTAISPPSRDPADRLRSYQLLKRPAPNQLGRSPPREEPHGLVGDGEHLRAIGGLQIFIPRSAPDLRHPREQPPRRKANRWRGTACRPSARRCTAWRLHLTDDWMIQLAHSRPLAVPGGPHDGSLAQVMQLALRRRLPGPCRQPACVGGLVERRKGPAPTPPGHACAELRGSAWLRAEAGKRAPPAVTAASSGDGRMVMFPGWRVR